MLFLHYIYWHYLIATRNIWEIWSNYERATWHRFLIVRHLQTLLAPWHRQRPSDVKKSRDATGKILDGMIDFYVRIAAALVRLTIVATGLVVQFLWLGLFIALFFAWLLWPLILVISVIKGLTLVF